MFMKVNKFSEWEESYYLDPVHSVVVTSDNKYLISGSSDRSIKVFDLNTKQEIYHFKNAHKGKSLKCKDIISHHY